MKRRRLAKNTIASVTFQITTIICGFILPQAVLKQYGTEINGLVNSITQFLSAISFLEMGVGAVIQSSLYKPLAEKDKVKIEQIVSSGNRFFRTLAHLLLVYVCVLIAFYPRLANQQFGWSYTAALIAAMSVSSFAQYYFGILDRLLLTADQRGYIQFNAQTISVIFNTIFCVLLIYKDVPIYVVKITTAIIYLLRQLYIHRYVKKHYALNYHATYEKEPIQQKWNGLAQHIAAVILDGTDTIVLTLFSSLTDVSIYSVYNLVVMGVKQLFLSLTNGVQAVLGELWAKKRLNELREMFGWVEWGIHAGTVFVFGCTGTLIVPFVEVYTKGVTDANYNCPLFALLITLANACHCLRLPYNIMILAGGHYKQTQNIYITAAAINIGVSVLAVKQFGLVGVAVGTLVAMLYQTVCMVFYSYKNFIDFRILSFVKQILVDLVIVVVACLISRTNTIECGSYLEWGIMACWKALIWAMVVIVFNEMFYPERMRILVLTVTNILRPSKK